MTRIQLLVTYKGAAFLGFGALLKPNEEDPSHFLKQASSAASGASEASARCSELVKSGSWPSVQNVLEMALRLYLPHGLSTGVIVGSSRTDAGVCFPHPSFLHSFIHSFTHTLSLFFFVLVFFFFFKVHAESNSCHFDMRTDRFQGEEQIVRALNQKLTLLHPHSICQCLSVIAARRRPFDSWHARHSATGRSYRYQLAIAPAGRRAHPLGAETHWFPHAREEWRLDAVREAAAMLVGTHDFSAFRGGGCQAATPVRTLREARVEEASVPHWGRVMEEAEGRQCVAAVHMRFVGSAFLYHQVRNMVGVLNEVGIGRMSVAGFGAFMEARRRAALPGIAPPQRLFL